MTEHELEGFRLSPQQERAWALGGDRLHAAGLAVLSGSCDEGRLRAAVAAVVARHEILRTVFPSLPGMSAPLQRILAEPRFQWECDDLRGRDAAEALAELERGLSEVEPFDLQRGPLLRCRLARLAGDRAALVITLPALCADDATLDLFLAELSHAYVETGAYAPGAGGADPGEEGEGDLQYADLAEWQAGMCKEEEAGFWQRLEIPNVEHRLRSARDLRELAGEILTVSEALPDATAGALGSFLREHGLDAESFWFAAWLLFARRNVDDDVVTVSKLFSCRTVEPLDAALGPIAKYIPVFYRPDPGAGFLRNIGDLRVLIADFAEHQIYFSWSLLSSAGAARSLGFSFCAAADAEAGGLGLSWQRKVVLAEPFDVELCVEARARDGHAPRVERLSLRHRGDRLDAARARRLLQGFMAMVDELIAHPGRPLRLLGTLGHEERRLVLDTWNHTARDVPAASSFYELFSRQAGRSPDRAALVFGDRTFTYRELDVAARRAAAALRKRGAGPEVLVPLVVERSIEAIVGLLAVLAAGGAYVPIDPHQPEARSKLMLAGLGKGPVLSVSRWRDLLVSLGVDTAERAVFLDRDLDEPTAAPEAPARPEHAAYMIYTSGSTGTPKGVVVTNTSLVNLAFAMRESAYSDLRSPLRVSLNAPLVFDASIKQLTQLAFGDTLHLVPEEIRPDGEALLAFLQQHRLDVLDVTPSQLKLLLYAGLERHPEALPARVLIGGEALDPADWERLGALSATTFLNVYGPTENTDVSTTAKVTSGGGRRPVIGRPIANVRAYVLDGAMTPVPVGATGELYLGGAGVSRGYLGGPALTAARFVPDPFSGEPGARLYRSGDLVRLDDGGDIEFLGRADHQVKIRGYRVELGEIESVIAAHPGVAQAAVTVGEGSAGDPRLVGYVVPSRKGSSEVDGRERHRLPNDMAVVHQNKNETDYLYEEIFVKKSYSLYGIELPKDAVVFDVGANIGMFSLYVASHCEGARVFAFEPLGPIYECLARNAELYGEGVEAFQLGLSDREESRTFAYYPRYSMMSGAHAYAKPEDEVQVIRRYLEREMGSGSAQAAELLAHADELLAGRFEAELHACRLRRLGDVIRERGVTHIDLLKIDVQRAEMDVLRGLDDRDFQIIDQVVMEVHAAAGEESETRLDELRACLGGHGFEVVVEQDELLQGTDRYNVYASRRGLKAREHGLSAMASRRELIERARPVSPELLRDHTRDRLPEHMVPAAFVLLERFPLTRNGKVDRAALPPPPDLSAATGPAQRPPLSPMEEILWGLWADVLGTVHLGLDKSFFALGGHSLLVTQLVSRIREALQVDLPLRSVFEAPTIRSLARVLDQERTKAHEGAPRPEAPRLLPAPRTGELPLSFAQQRLWFLQQMNPEDTSYNAPVAFRVSGRLSTDTLQRALDHLVYRHEILRTTFVMRAERPVQVIHEPRPVSIPVTDLTAMEDPEREAEVVRRIQAEARRPFSLGEGPLFRLELLRLGPRQHVLIFDMHHIISDAWSMAIFVRELVEVYRALLASRAPDLPPLSIQYADYAVWQQAWLSGAVYREHLEHWRRRLSGDLPALQLPLDAPRERRRHDTGRRAVFTVDPELTAALKALCARYGTTLYMTLLSAFLVLLGRTKEQKDLLLGLAIAGRDRVETENVIGCFINMLVLRFDLSGAPRFADLLRQARKVTLDAYEHQAMPFDHLVKELNPPRGKGVTPFFQAAFGLQNAPIGDLRLPGLEFTLIPQEQEKVRYDLTIWVNEQAGGLSIDWTYSDELFQEQTIADMARRYEALLRAVAADPEARIHSYELLSAEDKQGRREEQARKQASLSSRLSASSRKGGAP
ncbi:uncharacterized protein SOCE26_037460 [Sorangium cellulosum]|uniref:Carrier domain-containing protein n=1 Tax=Sorangium cellulosum TaxID=56 RepID=A0A2L0ESN9_SORCE|nr:non-ribosomal peptide synthetase [Sorangium cellulosum]AUX42316.1 uncharacterized protein SOCE26_037460 [Sorangium cellulosum]